MSVRFGQVAEFILTLLNNVGFEQSKTNHAMDSLLPTIYYDR